MSSSSVRWLLVMASVVLALGVHAQTTWTYKGGWGEATLTFKPDGTCPTTYKNGNGTNSCTYTVVRIVGTMVYLTGASGLGFTADGWMTPTHHQFKYYGREGGCIDLDGNNTVPQSMLDGLAKLPYTPADNPKDVVPGLAVAYYASKTAGDLNKCLTMDKWTPDSTGSLEDFNINGFSEGVQYGVKYTGYIDVPKDDLYNFYINSDDGSLLYIGDTRVCENDGGHAASEEPGVIKLAAGKHAITVYYTQLGGSQAFSVSYAGSTVTKTSIPASMLYRDAGKLDPIKAIAPVFTPTPSGPNSWLATACANINEAKNVLSGTGTRWTTNRAMTPGDWLQIDMLKGYKLKNVTLESAAPADAAHGVQLWLAQDNEKIVFSKVAELSADDCAKLNGTVTFTLPAGGAARYVKFVQTGSNGPSWWSVTNVDIQVDTPKP